MNEKIRNFVITAHVDHGKSTLADRMLEVTDTVSARQMKPQYLDQLDLERERGITIKMAPVRMAYRGPAGEYVLNLIDTPGHSDFSYEVSRALAAVEGAVLLVDATQGIQAQTLFYFEAAKRAGLSILGVVNKVDAATPAQVEEAVAEVAELIGTDPGQVYRVSGKTGGGVAELIEGIVQMFPPPRAGNVGEPAALIFDSFYDDHKGIIAFTRVFSGNFRAGNALELAATRGSFTAKEVGKFAPKLTAEDSLDEGMIGYIATGIKDPEKLRIGDTIRKRGTGVALPGYAVPQPAVFVSFYPDDQSDYDLLKKSLGELRLSDSALVFEPDFSESLGRGFKGGFLGRLHFEITAERLLREHGIETVHSFPSVAYRVQEHAEVFRTITNPRDFPDDRTAVEEPVTRLEIVVPQEHIGNVLKLTNLFRFFDIEVLTRGQKAVVQARLPLADLISDLDDKLKSVSHGYASLSYELAGWRTADVEKMEILVAGSVVSGLTRIVPRQYLEHEARESVRKLKDLLPKEQFTQALQARARGRIIARETIPAMRKDVTGYLYGGDRTRKMKLWKKQQKGKKRLQERAESSQVKISANVFKELLKR